MDHLILLSIWVDVDLPLSDLKMVQEGKKEAQSQRRSEEGKAQALKDLGLQALCSAAGTPSLSVLSQWALECGRCVSDCSVPP